MLRSLIFAAKGCRTLRSVKMIQCYYFSKKIPVKLGDLGEGTKEATIKSWFVQPGSEVKEFEDLCEVITDKLVAKIPSSYSGKIMKLNYQPDEICQVGNSLLEMKVDDSVQVKEETASEQKEEPKSEPPTEKPKEQPATKSEKPAPKKPEPSTGGKVLASPAVRAFAAEMKVDLKLVTPTGKGGKTTKDDVLKFISAQKEAKPSPATTPKKETAPATMLKTRKEDKTVKLSGIRKAMAKSMSAALTIPQYNLQDDFNIAQLKRVRKVFNEAHPNSKITYLPFLVKAFSQAMVEFPLFNALTTSNTDQDGYIAEYIEKAEHNICIAVDSPSGLLVPNIKSCQRKSILEIQEDALRK